MEMEMEMELELELQPQPDDDEGDDMNYVRERYLISVCRVCSFCALASRVE